MNYYYDDALSRLCIVCVPALPTVAYGAYTAEPQMISKINGECCLANCDTHQEAEGENGGGGDENGIEAYKRPGEPSTGRKYSLRTNVKERVTY